MAVRDPLILGVQYTLTAAAIAFFVHKMRQQKFKAASTADGNRRALKAPIYIWWLAFGGLAFWIGLIVLAQLVPGKTPPDKILLAQLIFGTFAFLSLLVGSFCFCDVVWDDDILSGPAWYGKRVSLRWSDIKDVRYNAACQTIVADSQSHGAIWISEYWTGVADFLSYVKERYPQMSVCTNDDLYKA